MKFSIRGKGFKLINKEKFGRYYLLEIIVKYNLFDYKYIYKASRNFKLISIDELLKEENCIYLFCNDDYTEHFKYVNGIMTFLSKPLPDIKYLKKIKIK